MKAIKSAPYKGAIVHGALLLLMLIYGYRVWTRDKSTASVTTGTVVLWNKAESDLVAIEYAAPNRTVKLEHRGEGAAAYWWGIETKETPAHPPIPAPTAPMAPPGPGSAAGSGAPPNPHGPAGKPPTMKPPAPATGAGAGSAAAKPPAAKPPTPAPAGSGAGPAKWGPGDGSDAGSGSAGSGSSAKPPGPGSAKPPGPGSGSSAGSGATPPGPGSGSGADPGSGSTGFDPLNPNNNPDAPPPVTTTREFPIGTGAEEVIKGLTNARAMRELGAITDDQKKEYKLDETSITLSVVLKSGTRTFVIGGSVYGGADKYVLDTDSNKAYVLSGKLLSPFEQGESGLRLNEPKGFAADAVAKVTVTAGGKARTAVRILADAAAKPDPANPHAPPPGKTKTWGDPATNKPDQTIANFIDNADRLKPTKYESDLDPTTLTEVVKLAYQDAKGAVLGTMTISKRDKPAEGAMPPTTEYYIVTEKTRVPGLVPKSMAERVDQDVPTVFPAE